MSWTDERIERLTKMWEGGATASQIADELGGVSRNAVIGKAHRLGLKARPSPVKANEKPEPPAPAAKPVAEAPRAPQPLRTAAGTRPHTGASRKREPGIRRGERHGTAGQAAAARRLRRPGRFPAPGSR